MTAKEYGLPTCPHDFHSYRETVTAKEYNLPTHKLISQEINRPLGNVYLSEKLETYENERK